MTTESHKNTCA